jgi:hypothetical protein
LARDQAEHHQQAVVGKDNFNVAAPPTADHRLEAGVAIDAFDPEPAAVRWPIITDDRQGPLRLDLVACWGGGLEELVHEA